MDYEVEEWLVFRLEDQERKHLIRAEGYYLTKQDVDTEMYFQSENDTEWKDKFMKNLNYTGRYFKKDGIWLIKNDSAILHLSEIYEEIERPQPNKEKSFDFLAEKTWNKITDIYESNIARWLNAI